MFESIKRLAKHSIIYGFGTIAERLLVFLLLPLFIRFLSPVEIGIYYLLYAAIAFLNPVYVYGLNVAFLRFYISADSPKHKSSYFSTTVLSLIITTSLFSGLIYYFADNINILITKEQVPVIIIKMIAAILFLEAFSLFGFLVLRAEERAKQYMSIKVVKTSIVLILSIIFVWPLKLNLYGVFLAVLIGSCISFIFVLPVYFRVFRIIFDTRHYIELLKFGLPYLVTIMAFVVIDLVDKYFIEYFLGTKTVGVYGVSYQIARVMKLLVGAFALAWHPFFLSIQKQDDCKRIYARVLTYFTLISSALFLFIAFFAEDLLRTFPILGDLSAEEYSTGFVILPYILLAYFFSGIYVNLIAAVYITKKTHYLAIVVGLSAILNLIGNYLLIPDYGIIGAAVSTTISYFVMVVLIFLINRKIYPVNYEWKRLIICLTATALVYISPQLINSDNQFVIKLAAFTSLPVMLWISGFFASSEINKLKSGIGKIFKIGHEEE